MSLILFLIPFNTETNPSPSSESNTWSSSNKSSVSSTSTQSASTLGSHGSPSDVW